MKHTGALSLSWLAGAACLGAVSGPLATPPQDPQAPTLKDLVERLQKREKALKSLDMEILTRDRFPGGGRIETRGRLRVLPGTHFHSSMTARFGDGSHAMEMVSTPKGVWTRQHGPIEEVYTFMSPTLRNEMEHKTRKLGESGAKVPGPLNSTNKGLLGEAAVTSLNEQFDLAVTGNKNVDGARCWIVSGPRRKPKKGEDDNSGDGPMGVPIPQRAVLLLRDKDGVPVQMRQFDSKGEEVITFEVKKLVMDSQLDESSFKIAVPEGVTFIDVEKHPPSWAQILRVREAYAELMEKDKSDQSTGAGKRQAPASKASSRPDAGKRRESGV